MPQEKRWIIAEPSPDAGPLADALRTSTLIAQMLINRGIADPESSRRFMSPSLKYLHEPQSLPGIADAAERIARAIRDRQRIVVYGDYDVDGITGTSILWHAIRLLGGDVHYYIPHRLDEGYGINAEAIEQLAAEGASLIVSVDCGITASQEAAVAQARGVELLITDHHDWRIDESGRPLIPEGCRIVHPRLPRDGADAYPNPHLCGAGVAFKLAWAIGQAHGGATRVSQPFREFLVEATALAALGTVADVVPLKGENRVLVHYGLGGLKESRLTGVRALIESAGLTGQKLDSYHLGFLLAPRLNACGRMGHAREAVEMLTVADAARARQIADQLEQQNRARQDLEKRIFEQAMEQALRLGCDRPDCRGIVLGSDDWHPGVIGIVASRVVGRLNRPTIMVALAEEHGHGSGRSIPGFHLARALNACRDHLETCGGHEMAAGLRVRRDRLDSFRAAFAAYAQGEVSDEMLIPSLRIDAVATLRQITFALVNDMQRLGPFGTGNPRPVLCCRQVEMAAPPRRVGRTGDHLQLVVRQDGVTMKCIAFGRGSLADQLAVGRRIDLAVEPCIHEYNGLRGVQLEVRDVAGA